MSLQDKTVLITGANRGIGYALTEVFLEKSWNVIATVRAQAKESSLDNLGRKYPKQLCIEFLDALKPESILIASQRLSSVPIDILINNAGIIGPELESTIEMDDFEGFKQTFEVNALGPLRVSKAFHGQLQAACKVSGIAKVATISSAMGSMSHTESDQIAYRASKSAVNKVMQGLATDLTPENIAVFIIHPGWVRTDMGGARGDIDARTSAEGICTQITKRGLTETGSFFDYKGKTVSW